MIKFTFFLPWVFWISGASAAVPARTEVVIVGAGLSGLSTAYQLKKAGIPFHILELTPRIGGRVRTVSYQIPGQPEVTADSGMEEYWESNPAVPLLKELKLPTRGDVAASSLVLDGKLEILGPGENTVKFLARIFNTQERQALEGFKARVAPLIAQLRSGKAVPTELLRLKEMAFSKWVQDLKLPRRVAEWVRVSLECEIGTQWDRLSALDGISEFHIFLGQGERSYRVIGGNEKFTEALARKIGTEHISVNQMVKRIETKGDDVAVSYLDTATHRVATLHAHHVVSTIPLFRLFEVQFNPALSDAKRNAIASQTWGSYFKVHLLVPKKAERFWSHSGESFLPLLSDSDLGVIYEGNPDQRTPTRILSLLITGDRAEAMNLMNQDAVRARILAGFDKLWPGFTAEIQQIEFYRYHPRAIAGWPVGRSRYDALSDEIRRPENRVYLAGDFTENTHSSGAFESAARVVRQIQTARSGAQKAGNP